MLRQQKTSLTDLEICLNNNKKNRVYVVYIHSIFYWTINATYI